MHTLPRTWPALFSLSLSLTHTHPSWISQHVLRGVGLLLLLVASAFFTRLMHYLCCFKQPIHYIYLVFLYSTAGLLTVRGVLYFLILSHSLCAYVQPVRRTVCIVPVLIFESYRVILRTYVPVDGFRPDPLTPSSLSLSRSSFHSLSSSLSYCYEVYGVCLFVFSKDASITVVITNLLMDLDHLDKV